MNNYPPGVSGNEPQITGEWPCVSCDGAGGERDEDGVSRCPHCNGTGIEPEEFELEYVEELADEFYTGRYEVESVLAAMRHYRYDRKGSDDRRMLRALATLNSIARDRGWSRT